MATYTYTNATGDWFTAANWSGGKVPGNGDIGDLNGNTVNVASDPTVGNKNWVVSYQDTLGSGTLNLSAATIAGQFLCTAYSVAVQQTGSLTVNGQFTSNQVQSNFNSVAVNGYLQAQGTCNSLTINAGGSAWLAGGMTVNSSLSILQGGKCDFAAAACTISAGATFYFDLLSELVNSNQIVLSASCFFYINQAGSLIFFVNPDVQINPFTSSSAIGFSSIVATGPWGATAKEIGPYPLTSGAMGPYPIH